jgi:CheY-like chemotaxis protein
MTNVPLVYVVDDEGTIASTTALILNLHAYEAIAFTQPQKALQAAEERCPDFLITDVSMRAMNGIELGMRFKDLYPTCISDLGGFPDVQAYAGDAFRWTDYDDRRHRQCRRFLWVALSKFAEVLNNDERIRYALNSYDKGGDRY